MSKTKIAWTDETANWIVGCAKTRAKGAKESGCDNCYAATAANSARLQQFDQHKKVVDGKGNWNGNIEFVPKVLDDLLKGKRSRRVFAPSMSDPFHPAVNDEWLDQFMAVVALTPHITYQCLTKRPERMYDYFDDFDLGQIVGPVFDLLERNNKKDSGQIWKLPLPNLHLGATVENQSAADERIPWLLKTPAAKRFLSVEPLLEEIDFQDVSVLIIEEIMFRKPEDLFREKVLSMGSWEDFNCLEMLNQIIVGGESGSNARPFHLEWARSLLKQCRESDTKVFMKQVGSNAFYKGQPFKTKSRSGADISEWPEDLQVQESIVGTKNNV